MKSILFYTIGYPGAGKTSFAKQLATELGVDHLYADKVGFELFGKPKFSAEEVKKVRTTMDELASRSLAEGKSVVYDAMVARTELRKNLDILAKDKGGFAIGIWLQTPELIARSRAGTLRPSEFIKNHFRVVPDELFDKYLAAFQPPPTTKRVIRLSGVLPFSSQLESFQNQLTEIIRQLP